jgi:hypothetical protein
MTNAVFHTISGIFIILVAIGFSFSQIGITKFFHYPHILRQPTPMVLQLYNEQRKKIQPYWVIFSFSSLMLIALSAIFYQLLNNVNTPYLLIGTFFGIAASIFYVIGLMRWVFLADNLSSKYMAKDNSEEKKDMIVTVFESFHVYCGNSIGETMGFLCMGIWIAITGIAITASTILPWQLGCGYIVCGVGIGMAPFEWIGFRAANKINKISMKILMACLVITGIILIIR